MTMLYSQRIFWPQYNTDAKLQRLFEFLKKHRPLAQEISFFTEGDGCDWRYVTPDDIVQRAAFLKRAVQMVRAEGFIPVINILNTLGHSDDGGSEAPVPPWQEMVGLDGTQTRHCSCPADPDLLDYVRFKYEQFARCGADRYWIDDDLRVHNHNPVHWGCFCPQCVADFSCRMGREYDLPGLEDALRTDRKIRAAWIARAGEVSRTLLAACAEGVRKGNPIAEIGLMTGDVTSMADAGVDLEKWFNDLTTITGTRGWLRPGGGFWDDNHPRGVLGKLHGVANTIDRLPQEVGVTYEMENYPFTLGSKSAKFTGLECLMAILSTRLDGIMLDMLDLAGNELSVHERWVKDLEKWVPLWTQAAEITTETLPFGWRPMYSLQHFQQHAEERPPGEMHSSDYQKPCALQLAGVPITGFSEGAVGYLLGGEAARGMSVQELTALLQKPLIMDGDAAERFLAVGLGDRIGLRSATVRTEGAYEVFTDHPVNGPLSGYRRAMTMKYFGLRSHALEPIDGVGSLSTLVNYKGEPLGSSLTLCQPTGQSPVAVISHAPWSLVLSPQRMTQMRRLTAAMTDGMGIPAITSCDRAVAYWYRRGKDGEHLAVLCNLGFDDVIVELGGVACHSLLLATPDITMEETGAVFMPGWSVAVVRVSFQNV